MKNIIQICILLLISFKSFSIDPPVHYLPGNNTTGWFTDRSIRCYTVDGITNFNNYTFEIDTTPLFNSALLYTSSGTDYYTSPAHIRCEITDLNYNTTYYWRVKVTDGLESSEWSDTWNFTTIVKPSLYLPSNNATGQYTDRSLRCYDEDYNTDFDNYEFEIDTSSNFDSPLYHTSHGTSSTSGYIYKSNFDLLYGTKYYWRARVRNTNDTSEWSDTWNFTTIVKPSLYLPSNNATGQYTDRSLRCYDEDYNTDFDNYEFEIDTSSNFDSPLYHTSHGTSSTSGYIYKSNFDLLYGTKYYWRARVRNTNDTSEWSDTWNFTTIVKPSLYLPSNNATGQYTDRSLRCYDEDYNTDFDNYEFEIDTSSNFDSPLYHTSHGTSSSSGYIYKSNSDLLYGQKYYWRARVRNTNDTSEWSDIWNFTTMTKPSLYLPSNNATGQYTDRSLRCYDEDYNTDYENYEFEIDTSSNFDSPLYHTSHGTSSTSGYIYKSNFDLLYGTKYYWRARVKNTNDTSEWSDTWNFTTTVKPSLYLPSNNATGQYTDRSLRCYDEDYNTDFDNYEFEIDTSSNFDSPLYHTSHGTSSSSGYIYKSNSDLLYGQKYYWRARVRNTNDTSEWSDTWNFTSLYQINLYSPSNNAQNLSINTTLRCYDEDYNTDFDNYEFEIDTTINFNSPLYEISHGTSSSSGYIYKSNSGLRYGQTYYWRARVRNTNDTSEWSSTWNFKTEYELIDGPELNLPANNSTDQPYSSLLLDWNSVSNANNYQYQVSTENDFSVIIKTGNTSLTEKTISDLLPNTLYYWRVRAENINGYSPWSAEWNFTTEQTILEVPELISPINNAAYIDYRSIDFSWNPVIGASEYTFEISQDNSFSTGVTSLNTSSESVTMTNLEAETVYYWRVNASDGITVTDWSEIRTLETMPAPPELISPPNNSIDIDYNSVSLTWTDISTSYWIQLSTDETFTINVDETNTTSNTEIYGDLTPQTTYYWRVCIDDGFFNWSDAWNFTTMDVASPLDPPELVSPEDGSINQQNIVSLDWNEVTNAIEYTYQYSTDETFTVFTDGNTSDTQATIGTLEYNTLYYWKVIAYDGDNYSSWSEVWCFTTEEEPIILDPPMLISPENGSDEQAIDLTLDWEAVTNAFEYEYQYSIDNSFTSYTDGITSDTETAVSGLEYETEYFWRVRASNGSQFSEWSDVWSFTTEIDISVLYSDAEDIHIYPNPADSYISLNLKKLPNKIAIISISGKLFKEIKSLNTKQIINISELNEGIYILKIEFDKYIIQKRFIILR
jgi:N-acetylmuramoyl-L-alanine amidase CwlA